MSTPGLQRFTEELVSYARSKGADQCEVVVVEGTDFSVDVREGTVERLVEAGSKNMALRLFVGGKSARGTSNDLTPVAAHRLVDNALERAKLASPDPLAGLPDGRSLPPDPAAGLKIFDPAVVEMKPEAKIALAKETEAIALREKRIKKSYGASFGTNVGAVHLANSNGVSGSYQRTSCSCGVQLQTGEEPNLFDEGWSDTSTTLSALQSPEEIARTAVTRATRLIGGRKVETQNVPVVLEPQMSEELLRFFLSCVSGNNVYLKQSFLAGKLNEKVGSDLVTIIDDGLLPGGLGTRPFDGEGVPVHRTEVISKGVLKNYLLDTYAARKLGLRSTGNSGGPNNLHLVTGTSTPAQIIGSVDNGLLLTGVIGFGLVPTTGDISRGAFGMWIEKGQISYPVAEITISGNLGQVLQGIQMVGNDMRFNSTVVGPTIKIAEMTVGGK